MADKPLLIGFAGHGEASSDLVTAELDDFLPEDLEIEGCVVPKEISRAQKGLKNVVAWLTEAFDEGEDSFTVSGDVVADLAAHGTAAVLVLLYDEQSPQDYDLFEAASKAGVRCVDLTKGMDAMKWEEPEPDPEPEPPAAPARKRRSRAGATTAEKVADGTRAAIEETVGKEGAWTLDQLIPIIDAHMAFRFRQFAELLTQDLPATGRPPEPRKSPESKVPPGGSESHANEPGETYNLIRHEDGEVKLRGRGRPRRGQEEFTLSRAEMEEQYPELLGEA